MDNKMTEPKLCPRCQTPMVLKGGCCSKAWQCPNRDCRWREAYKKEKK